MSTLERLEPPISRIVPRRRGVGLGPCVMAKRVSPRGARFLRVLGVLGVVGWLLLAALLTWRIGSEALGTVLLVGGIVLPAAAAALHHGRLRSGYHLAVHEDGLVISARGGDETDVVFAWSEVAEVYEHEERRAGLLGEERKKMVTFVKHDGRQAAIDADEIGRLAATLAQETMLPGYELGLAAGRRLGFGAIALNGWGLCACGVALPWSAIAFVRWDGAWAVHLGAWAVAVRIPSDQVANALVLLDVLERLDKLDGPKEAVVLQRLAAA